MLTILVWNRDQDVQLRIRGKSDSGQTIEIRQDTTVQSDQVGRHLIIHRGRAEA